MPDADPHRAVARIVASPAGLVAIGWGVRAIVWGGDLHYVNWFGELVFGPIAILLGAIVLFGAVFKPEILGRTSKPPKR